MANQQSKGAEAEAIPAAVTTAIPARPRPGADTKEVPPMMATLAVPVNVTVSITAKGNRVTLIMGVELAISGVAEKVDTEAVLIRVAILVMSFSIF